MSVFRAILLPSLLLAAWPGVAGAFSLVEGSFRVEPAEVTVSRTITLTAEIEDEQGLGAGSFEVEVSSSPAGFTRLVSGGMPQLTCSGSRRTKGRWVFEALAPGQVEFKLTAAILGCKVAVPSSLDLVSPPVKVNPLPLWSGLEIVPRVVQPGEEFEVRLSFRNDADFEIVLVAPELTPDLMGDSSIIARPVGKPLVEPPSAVRNRRLILPAGKPAKVTWRFQAERPGKGKFLITGGGMVVTTPEVLCRGGGALIYGVPELEGPIPVGREVRVRGRLYGGGEAQVGPPTIALTWSPPGAARLVGEEIGRVEALYQDSPPLDFMWRVQATEPGKLSFRIAASATEVDSGMVLNAEVERKLRVLPQPDLDLQMVMSSSTVLAGGRVDFRLVVTNRNAAEAQNITPILSVRRGKGKFTPLQPAFQGIASQGRAVFTGAFLPAEEGATELAARITGRGERGGPRVEAVSDPVDLNVLPQVRMDMFTLNSRVRSGTTAEAKFLLVNRLKYPLRLKAVSLGVSGGGSGTGANPRIRPLPITLGPGASATLYAKFPVAGSAKTEYLIGSAQVTGEVMPLRIPFSWQAGSRLLAVSGPATNRIAILEPGTTFNPPRDLAAYIEYTLASAGPAGLVVLDAGKRVVRRLEPYARRGAGWHSVLWDGTDDEGKPVPPAAYTIRLAGPAAGADAGWPESVKWKHDLQLGVVRP